MEGNVQKKQMCFQQWSNDEVRQNPCMMQHGKSKQMVMTLNGIEECTLHGRRDTFDRLLFILLGELGPQQLYVPICFQMMKLKRGAE